MHMQRPHSPLGVLIDGLLKLPAYPHNAYLTVSYVVLQKRWQKCADDYPKTTERKSCPHEGIQDYDLRRIWKRKEKTNLWDHVLGFKKQMVVWQSKKLELRPKLQHKTEPAIRNTASGKEMATFTARTVKNYLSTRRLHRQVCQTWRTKSVDDEHNYVIARFW